MTAKRWTRKKHTQKTCTVIACNVQLDLSTVDLPTFSISNNVLHRHEYCAMLSAYAYFPRNAVSTRSVLQRHTHTHWMGTLFFYSANVGAACSLAPPPPTLPTQTYWGLPVFLHVSDVQHTFSLGETISGGISAEVLIDLYSILWILTPTDKQRAKRFFVRRRCLCGMASGADRRGWQCGPGW